MPKRHMCMSDICIVHMYVHPYVYTCTYTSKVNEKSATMARVCLVIMIVMSVSCSTLTQRRQTTIRSQVAQAVVPIEEETKRKPTRKAPPPPASE